MWTFGVVGGVTRSDPLDSRLRRRHDRPMTVDFAAHRFHPVVLLPEQYDVNDFTVPRSERSPRTSAFDIGDTGVAQWLELRFSFSP